MKLVLKISIVILSLCLFYGCKKDKPTIPVLKTIQVSGIGATTAISGGNITSDGGSVIIASGVCWSTGVEPTINDNNTSDTVVTGSFTSNITGLDGGTLYYVRAYATNIAGTGYGTAISFTTLGQAPTVSTGVATNLTTQSVKLNGTVNANYLSTVVTFEYGTTLSYGSEITATPSPVTGGSSVNVSAILSGLSKGTIYYIRAYATNGLGTIYGDPVTVTTATVSIGESYRGGLVAYVLQPGDPGYIAGETHGIIAAPTDQGSVEWGCNGADISGADGTALGTGKQTTSDIVNGCATSDIAAKLCYDLVLNGYDDWYLPSKDELNKLFVNRESLGSFLDSAYWSSSEYNSSFAWYQIFQRCCGLNGAQYYIAKSTSMYVRAIRSF